MILIAIDGTSASGKGTLAKKLAEHYNIEHIDTGAMYRAVALYVIENGLTENEIETIIEYAKHLDIHFDNDRVLVAKRDVSLAIRNDEVSMLASKMIAVNARIRAALVKRQQEIAQTRSVVMDGRDIGSVVLPDAKYKFFIDASSEARAKRRFEEQNAKGFGTETYETILADIIARDKQDYSRTESPLVKVSDAYLIDTSNLTIDEVVEKALNQIEKGV